MGRVARQVLDQATAFATTIGVQLDVDHDHERGRLMFAVKRTRGKPGAGAIAIKELLKLADGIGIPVVIDVLQSEPALIKYYWQFGFRMMDGGMAAEKHELDKIIAEQAAHMAKPGANASDIGVVFMDRPIGGVLQEAA